jgi:hypothetical protein
MGTREAEYSVRFRHAGNARLAPMVPRRRRFAPVVRPPASLGESIHNADNSQTVPRVRFMRYLGVLESETMRAVGRKVFLALALEDLI